MTDFATISRARRGKRLAKLIRADGTVEDYDAAFLFDLIDQQVMDLTHLRRLLHWLMARPACARYWELGRLRDSPFFRNSIKQRRFLKGTVDLVLWRKVPQ